MASKLYLHATTSGNTGTLPASNVSVSATSPSQIGDSGTNRTMDLQIGASQTSIAITTAASTSAQPSLIGRFISPALAQQTIASQNIVFHIGGSESNGQSNFQVRFAIAVWRPSTGQKVGLITDLTVATLEAGTGETALNATTTGSTSQDALEGDVLVLEVWRDSTVQGNAVARTNTIFYDGTTEDSTTSNAAYVNFPNTIGFVTQATWSSVTSGTWPDAVSGGAWTLSGTGTTYDSDGTVGKITRTASGNDSIAKLSGTSYTSHDGYVEVSLDITSSVGSVKFGASLTDSSTLYGTIWALHSVTLVVDVSPTINGSGSLNSTGITYNAGDTWAVKWRVIVVAGSGTIAWSKAWKLGTSEPDWYKTSSATVMSAVPVMINSQMGTATSTVISIDNLYIVPAYPQGWGQAQADIKAVNNGLGQANSDIKTTYFGLGQAQGKVASPYAALVLSDGAIAHWRLDEVSGLSIIDSTGNGNTLTLSGSHYTLNQPGLLSNDNDTSIFWDGSQGTVSDLAGGTPNPATVTAPYTVELWTKLSTVAGDRKLFGTRGPSEYGMDIAIQSNKIHTDIGNGSGWISTTADASVSITTSVTYHIVLTVTTTGYTIYLDGVWAGSGTWATATPLLWDATHVVDLAGNGHGVVDLGINGYLDEVSVYGTALTPTQVLNHYNVGSGNHKAVLSAFGQAQADIKAVNRGFGQAQGLLPSKIQFGQAQADIKAIGQGYGQTQADTKASGFGLGQSNADIKATNNGFGQSQVDIKATSFGLAQSQADINQTYPLTVRNTVSPTGNVLVVSGTGETILPGCNLLIPAATNVFISINLWVSHSNVGHGKNLTARLRRGGIGGTVIASNDFPTPNDDTSGHQYQWQTTLTDNSPGTNYVLTVESLEPLQDTYSDTRQFEITLLGSFGQAQADIKAVRFGLGQANADIKAQGYGLGQAQSDVKQTYFGLGQSNADILQTYFGSGQSQGDIKASGFGSGQGNADILAKGYGFGQAQAKIPDSFLAGFGQSQPVIGVTDNLYTAIDEVTPDDSDYVTTNLPTGNYTSEFGLTPLDTPSWLIDHFIFVRAQGNGSLTVNLKEGGTTRATFSPTLTPTFATYKYTLTSSEMSSITDYSNLSLEFVAVDRVLISYADFQVPSGTPQGTRRGYGQAQADIRQTYYGSGQSQADIKATNNGSGQAQATIVGNAFGQSQADIKQTYNQFGQAQADVLATSTQFGQAQADVKSTYSAVAQAQADVKATSQGYGQSQADILQVSYVFGQAQADITQTYQQYAQAQADIKATGYGSGQSQSDIKAVGYGSGQSQADILAVGYGFGQAQSDIKQTYQQYAQAQADIKQTYYESGQSNADIKQTYYGSGQAQSDILATGYGFGQANADILATNNGFGQAQADIKATSNGYGQSQGDIRQTYFGSGQANADILASAYGSGQTQADIKAANYGSGQAQAKLNAFDYNQYGQAQGTILFTGTIGTGQAEAKINAFGVNGYGQTQADIKAQGYGSGQSNADIKATEYGSGQTQSDIKVTQSQFAQANADIKQTSNASAQSQADIQSTYFGSGQANADIKAAGYGSGQSQGDIKATADGSGQAQGTIQTARSGSGQANADILQTNNSFGQAQGDIKQTGYASGDAQADIKKVGYGEAQAQADIKATSNGYGQAQGDILVTTRGSGNANADIKSTVSRSAQAQADIKATAYASGQAQAYVNLIQYGSGTANSDIKVISNIFAQTQADIKQTSYGSGLAQAVVRTNVIVSGQVQSDIKVTVNNSAQAQATIQNGNFGWAQVNATITRTENASGQSEAVISKSAGYGQARVFIQQLHSLKRLRISDRSVINILLSDREISLSESDKGISMTLSDRMPLTLNISDRERPTLQIQDIEY